jgi:uncharacterized protein with FMN-binding domain
MSDISPSSIKETPELIEALKSAQTHEEMKAILAREAVAQRVVTPDAYDPSVLIPTAPGTAPRAYGKTITINGQKHIIEAATEAELLEKENAVMREIFAVQPAATQTDDAQPRDAQGRYTSVADDPAAKVELELRFKRGDITAVEYLRESGEIENYLRDTGVPIEELREAVVEKQSAKFTQSWADATQEFLNSPAGNTWPGGVENMRILGRLLERNNLTDQPSVETIAAAYECMKENNMLVENPEIAMRQKISEARTDEEVREAVRGSGLFSR